MVRRYGEAHPRIDPSAWLAPGSIVVGDVEIGADSSIWYGAVIRGDVDRVRIGQRTNVQDHCVLHVESGGLPCILGDEVTVGHRAVVRALSPEERAGQRAHALDYVETARAHAMVERS